MPLFGSIQRRLSALRQEFRRVFAREPTAPPPRELDLRFLEDRVLYSASPLASELLAAQSSGLEGQDVFVESTVVAADLNTASTGSPNDPNGAQLSSIEQIEMDLRDLDTLLAQLHALDEQASSESDALSVDASLAGDSHAELFEGVSEGAEEEGLTIQQTSSSRSHELLVIDTSLPDYEQLISSWRLDQDANSEFSVLLVDRSVDGLQFVSDYLAASDMRFDAIHIVTHGFVGGLQLGNVELTASNLNLYANQFDVWRSSLSEDADLFLYGCSIASGSTGTEFVNQLSNRLNVDTAASLDWTGAVALGGDWTLEYTQGSVDMSSGLGYSVELAWQFILSSNNAPVLDASASPTLGTVLEGATNPSGVTVASLVVDGSITDPDGSAVEAIAITALNTSLGTWQYSLNGGGSWLDVDTTSINSTANELALLLGPTAQLRLVPTGDLNGSLNNAITFRAWDMSSGGEGQYVVITSAGGSTSFSSASDTASITVTAVDDAPTFTNTLGGAVAYTEGGTPVVLDSNVQVFDAENSISNFSGSTLTLSRSGGANSQDLFSATGTLGALTQGSSLTIGGITIGTVTTNTAGTLVLTFNSSATNALVNSAMQQIAYSNSSDGAPANVQIEWTITTAPPKLFTEIAGAAGVADPGNGYLATWADYDKDGDLDLYITNNGPNVLYRNNGNGTFTDVTTVAGVGQADNGYDGIWGDYDNDGDPDLYVSNWWGQPNVLYRNNGNGTFTDVTALAGLVPFGGATHDSDWVDYDGDGYLDIYITEHYHANILYRNNGDGTFTNTTTASGLGDAGNGTASSWADFDNDGDLDVYVMNQGANALYRNNGNGTFTNITISAGVNYVDTGGRPTRNGAWGDFDNDGHLDLYLGNQGADVLYRNNGNGTFTDISGTAGIGIGDVGTARSAVWGDYDGDGFLDVYVTNDGQANVLYRNNGNGTFTNITSIAGVGDSGWGRDGVWSDFDGDGDPDIYVTNGGANLLYRNDTNLVAGAQGAGSLTVTGQVTVNITGVNDAPVLNTTFNPTFGSVLEGATNPSGVTVASLVVDGSITDPDGSAVDAIAITGLNASLGTWQYSLNGGGSWLDVDTASINSTANELALLLGPTAQLRLVPTGDLNGSLSNAITFRAWDQSTGSEGQYMVITSTGGGTAFSTASDTVTITVTPVNDAPTFTDTLGGTVTFTEGGTPVVLDSNVQVFDAENSISNFSGSTLTLSRSGGASAEDLFSATGTLGALTQGSSLTVDGITIGTVTTNSAGTLVLTFNSSATNALVNSAMQQIAYSNSSDGASANVQIEWTITTAPPSHFTNLTAGSGITLTGNNWSSEWGDYDRDGDLDLYVTSNGGNANALYRNDGNGTFTNVTAIAGLGAPSGAPTWGDCDADWGDYDGDGDLDLYLTHWGTANILYRNNGNGTFTNVTATAGVGHTGNARDVSWADFDRDGDLDIYVTNWSSQANLLYRNNGNGTFTDIAAAAGVSASGVSSYVAAWGDYDNDGYLDLYVTNYEGQSNLLYRNNGNGTFSDMTATAGVSDTSNNGEDAAWGDYNNDGYLDLYVNNSRGNVLYRNNGNGTFTDVTAATGVGQANGGSDASWVDYDGDGDVDLYLTNWGGFSNVMYRNNGNGTFTDITTTAGLSSVVASRHAAWGDFDGDGDIDLTVSNFTPSTNFLYRNDANIAAGAQGVGDGVTVTGQVTVNITGVNDAPVINTLALPTMASVLEGATNPSGVTVASLVVDGSITDPDGSAVEAIAITALNTSLGTWQYSLNGGASWLTIDASRINSSTNELALLLGPTAQLRLIPFGDLNGSVSDGITFRAWDQSSGSEGQYTVISSTGGSAAFSSASNTASITVTAVNDAPTFFRGDGITTSGLWSPTWSSNDFGRTMVLQPDGKIIEAGISYVGSWNFSMVRWNADGSRDATFGDGGRVSTPIGGLASGYSLVIQPDGKLILAGLGRPVSGDDFALIRYNTDGTLDSSFGTNGIVTTAIGTGTDQGRSVAIQLDGKIVVGGYSQIGSTDDFALVRYNADGSRDNSFGNAGIVTTAIGTGSDIVNSLTIQADGKILVAGTASISGTNDFALARYNANGSLDTFFGTSGRVTTGIGTSHDSGNSVIVQADGKILVAGTASISGTDDFALVRYNANGSLDTSFGTSGRVTTAIGTGSDSGSAVTLQADGKILVAGTASISGANRFAVVRYNSNGSLDGSFGSGGIVTTAGTISAAVGGSVLVQPDGKIVVSGYDGDSGIPGRQEDFCVVRYNADGSLDTTFGGNRVSTLSGSVSYTENGAAIVLASNAKVFDAENSISNFSGSTLTLSRSGGANSQDLFSLMADVTSNLVGHWRFDEGTEQSVADASGNGLVGQLGSTGGVDVNDPIWASGKGGSALTFDGSNDFAVIPDSAALDMQGKNLTIAIWVKSSDAFSTPKIFVEHGIWDEFPPDGGIYQIVAVDDDTIRFNFSDMWKSEGYTVLDYDVDFTDGNWHHIAGTFNDSANLATLYFDGVAVATKTTSASIGSKRDATYIGSRGGYEMFFPGGLDDARIYDRALTAAEISQIVALNGTPGPVTQGSHVVVSGTTIGTVTSNSGGTLVLTLNSSANNTLVNSAMQQIAYANSSDAPPANVQVLWTFNDGNSSAQGTGGALTATGTVTVNITSVNDAPTITSGYIYTLSGTNEDATSPGTLASAILSGASWADVDTGAISGLAITGITGSATWQYSTDGATWTNFGSVSGTNALLITSSSQVRYIPNGQNGETATFTYKAWDQTSGTASTNATPSYASTTSSGGTTTFSSNNATAQITVSSVNDTPLFSAATSGGGFNIISFGTGLSDQANRVARQSDGKILITGTTNSNYGVLRLNADGTVDTSFGTDGKVSIDVGGSDTSRNIRVLSDGKLLLVGRSSNGSNNDFTLVRLNADGSLDTSFDGDGKRLVPVGTADNAYDVAVQSDGKMIVVGEVDSDFGIIRLNTDGSLDTTFSGDGKLTQGFGNSDGALAVALQSDGKIVVSGWSANGETAVIRLNTDGSFDNTFGTNGMITAGVSGYDQGSSIAIQSDGKIVVGGHGNAGSGTGFFLMRLNANGTIDTSFSPGGADGDGKLVTWVATNPEFGSTLTLQPDGKILMTGVSNGSFGIIRVNSDGSLDTSFGTGGRASIDVGPGTDESRQVLVLPDGKLIVIGFSINTATDGTSDFSVIRLNANGSLDTTFNGSSGGGLGTTLSYSENAPPIVLAGLVQISDVELTTANNFSGATLTLARNSGANSQDLFSATGTLGTLTQGGNLFVGGTTIGTVTSNSGGTLVLTFNSSANNTLVNSAMQQIAYANSSDAPPASVQIDWTFSDGNSGAQGNGGALTTTGNVIVNIIGVNDSPVAANDTFTTSEDTAITFDVRSNDSDIDGPSLAVTQINGSPIAIGVSVTVTGGSVRLNAGGTLTFTPTANYNGSPSFTYTLSDGSLTATASVNGTVIAVDDAPTFTDTLGGSVSFTEGGSPVVLDSNVQIFDAENSISNFSGSALTLTRSGGANSQDLFSATGTLGALTQGSSLTIGGISIGTVTTNSNGTLTLTFNSNATNALVNSAMQQIAYANSSDAPTKSIQFDWTINTKAPIFFTNITTIAGVGNTGESTNGAWGDYDNDGDLDLYVTNFGQANVLYRNNSDGTFTDVTASASVGLVSNGFDAAWGDYDGDGNLDLYVTNLNGMPNVLYRNNGNGTFSDVSAAAGVSDPGNATAGVWGDYDNDGDLDIHVTHWNRPNSLFRNNGNGTFTNVAVSAGVNHGGLGYDGTWGDFDSDGDLDLYIANTGLQANILYRNNGNGTFTDVAVAAGVSAIGTRTYVCVFADYDNDGDLDLWVAHQDPQPFTLFRNDGNSTFTDVTNAAGVGQIGLAYDGDWGDYDNDGDLDLYVTCVGQPNILYQNNGDGTFTNITMIAGVGHANSGRRSAWADFDRDGDLDLYVTSVNGVSNVLYRNDANAIAALTTTGQVTVNITGVNDAPIAMGESYQTNFLTPFSMRWSDLLANDTDVEGDALSIQILALPSRGAVVMDGNGGMTYRPETNFVGTVTIVYAVSDGSLVSDSQTVQIAIGMPPTTVVALTENRGGAAFTRIDAINVSSAVASTNLSESTTIAMAGGSSVSGDANSASSQSVSGNQSAAGSANIVGSANAGGGGSFGDQIVPANAAEPGGGAMDWGVRNRLETMVEDTDLAFDLASFHLNWITDLKMSELAIIQRLQLDPWGRVGLEPDALAFLDSVQSKKEVLLEVRNREYFVKTSTPIMVGTAIGAGISLHVLMTAHFGSSLLSQSGVFMPLDPLTILEGSAKVKKSKAREDLLFEAASLHHRTST